MTRRLTVTEVVDRLTEVSTALELGDVESARTLIDQTCWSLAGAERAVERSRRRGCGVALTEREVATLGFLPDGSMSQKDIARELAVSRNTVKTHLKSLYMKLGVHARGEAIHRARELGLLPSVLPATPALGAEPAASAAVDTVPSPVYRVATA
jgi:DNA-binding NarL/FixJ family response regulator